MKLNLIEKAVLVMTGFGIPLVVYDHYKSRQTQQTQQEWRQCPWCHQYVEGPEYVWAQHVAMEDPRRRG